MKRLLLSILLVLCLTAPLGAHRMVSGTTDEYVYFVAVDSTDHKTREPGLSSFAVYYSLNGGTATAMTTPTVNETDGTNMPGVYELLIDEAGMTTLASGDDTGELCLHVTQASMAPVTRVIEIYRPKITAGNTLSVVSGGQGSANLTQLNGSATPVTNLNNVYNTAFSSSFDDTNDVWNARLTAVSDAAGIVTASGSSNTIQTDDSGYVKLSNGTGTGQVTISSGVVEGKLVAANDNVIVDPNVADLFLVDSGTNYASAHANSVVKQTADNAASGAGDATAANQTTIISHLTSIKGATFSEDTDQLEDLRDRGDAAWTTGSGTGLTKLASGTCQAGSAKSTIKLASGDSADDHYYKGAVVLLTGGTGGGQFATIRDNNASTKVCTIYGTWSTTPDNTTTYEIQATPWSVLRNLMALWD